MRLSFLLVEVLPHSCWRWKVDRKWAWSPSGSNMLHHYQGHSDDVDQIPVSGPLCKSMKERGSVVPQLVHAVIKCFSFLWDDFLESGELLGCLANWYNWKSNACRVLTSIEEKTIKKHEEMAMVVLGKRVFGKQRLLFTSSNGDALQMSNWKKKTSRSKR